MIHQTPPPGGLSPEFTAVSVADEFTAELADLLGAPATLPARVTAGDLEIAVARDRDAIDVDLAGWRRRFELGGDEDDGRDAAALALDLIGAALYGAARVVVETYAGVARRFTLQLLRDGAWQTLDVQGSRPWNPLARATVTTHLGDRTRPAAHAPLAVAPLPWAPWAGAAGYFGAAAETAPTELPVDGVLDLHNFRPREVKPLVLAFLDACLERQILQVRIIHGKGIGHLRRTVHALLDRHPHVRRYALGGHGGGSWGATVVDLSPKTSTDSPPRA